jgi:hypothetical protein
VHERAITTSFVNTNGLRFEIHECGGGDRLALCHPLLVTGLVGTWWARFEELRRLLPN